jgi:hypothetical protein
MAIPTSQAILTAVQYVECARDVFEELGLQQNRPYSGLQRQLGRGKASGRSHSSQEKCPTHTPHGVRERAHPKRCDLSPSREDHGNARGFPHEEAR